MAIINLTQFGLNIKINTIDIVPEWEQNLNNQKEQTINISEHIEKEFNQLGIWIICLN